MKVAFIHYHLKPGGVTTVIRQQVDALRKIGGKALVFAGEPPAAAFPAEVVPVSGLGYSSDAASAPPVEGIVESILAAIKKRWPGGCDLVHVHNPTLAKNTHLPGILESLQEHGLRLLLQIHDFAEDGRPGAYSHAPYPENCHYGVINSRDYDILLKAGLKREGLHLLPNMVSPLEADSNKPEAPFVLYPVRAIRRKNIGEALLLSLFFKTGHHLAVTLPPNSPVDMTAYEDWKLFSKKFRLPVRFEAGLKDDFYSLAATARCFMTTSITEGFGFSFLESWTAGKSLRGRTLPDICSDFQARGIELDDMYPRLMVPRDWLDFKGYLEAWRNALERASRRFAFVLPPAAISKAETQLAGSTGIDFGLLNEKYQKEVLQRLVEDPAKMTALKKSNPFLADLADLPVSQSRIRRNREVVLAEYNAVRYQEILQNIYKRAAEETVRHGIRKETLLCEFFDPRRLNLLKWGAYER